MSSGHSRLAASASSRWIACTGSIALIEQLKAENLIPDDNTSPAAELGTACHAVLEHCIKKGFNPLDLSDANIKKITPEHLKHIKITHTDIVGVSKYWEYIEDNKANYDVTRAEYTYDLSYVFGIDVGGTADVTQCKKDGVLHIGDYKNGRVVVDHIDNSQMYMYALGAYMTFGKKFKFKSVLYSIGQPNAFHELGPVRTYKTSIKDLLSWRDTTLIPAIEDIKTGNTTRVPGEKQCYWCEAKAFCPEYIKDNARVAEKEFADFASSDDIAFEAVEYLTDAEAVRIFEKRDAVLAMFDAIEKRISAAAQKHGRIGPYIMETKPGNRQIIQNKDLLNRVLKRYRVLPSMLYKMPPKVQVGVGEFETILRKTYKKPKEKISEIMDAITWKPNGKPKLVRVNAQDVETEFAHTVPRRKRRRINTSSKINQRKRD